MHPDWALTDLLFATFNHLSQMQRCSGQGRLRGGTTEPHHQRDQEVSPTCGQVAARYSPPQLNTS